MTLGLRVATRLADPNLVTGVARGGMVHGPLSVGVTSTWAQRGLRHLILSG